MSRIKHTTVTVGTKKTSVKSHILMALSYRSIVIGLRHPPVALAALRRFLFQHSPAISVIFNYVSIGPPHNNSLTACFHKVHFPIYY